VEAPCRQAGIATERRNIPSIKKQNGKNGQGDLVLKRVYLAGEADLILDVALNHEFGGNHMADIDRNGELCSAGRVDPVKILEAKARTKKDALLPGGLPRLGRVSPTPSCPA
jgi:hypothetical protein